VTDDDGKVLHHPDVIEEPAVEGYREHRVKIKSNGLAVGTSITIDGVPIRAQSVFFECNADSGISTITIVQMGGVIEFEGIVKQTVELPAKEQQ